MLSRVSIQAARLSTKVVPINPAVLSKTVQESAPVQTETVTVASTTYHQVSGVPVRIFRPSKNAMQSGDAQTQCWKLEFDATQNARWENPLMGWPSSGDAVQSLSLKFRNKEEAVRFAERQGWNYRVVEEKKAKVYRNSYADNFRYSKDELLLIKTK